MKIRFYNHLRLRGLLPGLYLSWEEITMTIVFYIDGPNSAAQVAGQSLFALQFDLHIPDRLAPRLLPVYNRLAERVSWIT